MKKVPPLRHAFVRVFTLLIASCTAVQAQHATDPCPASAQRQVSFDQEFPIDVNTEPYVIDEQQILDKERRFRECIHYSPTPDLRPLTLRALEVVKLYCKADSIRRARKIPANQAITGVWMIIGMENNDICYSFQPAALKVQPNGKKFHTFTSEDKASVYCYKNDAFVIDRELKNKQALYFTTVKIKHFDNRWTNPKRGKFFDARGNPRHRWRGDAREVFYSFQEILKFYSEKNPQENSPGEYYANKIYVNHSAAKFRRSWVHFWRVKHNTFITVDSGGTANKKDFAITSTYNRNRDTGTNLAHVCPSRCNNLRYAALPAAVRTTEAEK